MLKNPKAKGNRQERKAQKSLEKVGYYCIKAGASLGVFDLIALGKKEARLIQVKSNYCRPEEKEAIEQFKAPDYAVKELWIYKDRIENPIIKIIK